MKIKKFKSDIIVKLKSGIKDTQGQAIETILNRVGLEKNPKINTGKFFSIEVSGESLPDAEKKLEKIAQEVLSNPILEEYEILKVEEL